MVVKYQICAPSIKVFRWENLSGPKKSENRKWVWKTCC